MTITNEDDSCRRMTQTQREFEFALKTSATLQISRFQKIGCFIEISGNLKAEDSLDSLFEQQYALDYLTNIEGFDILAAEILISESTDLKEIFETVWNHIDVFEKSIALWLNYDISCNYWPCWNIYNQALLPYINFPSGSPSGIIGSPSPTLPNSLINKESYNNSAPQQNEKKVLAVEDGHSHVFHRHNYHEWSCAKQYFSVPQQVFVILAALDEVYEDDEDQSVARELLIQRTHLSPGLIEALINEKKWPRRFSILWESLSDRLKAELIAEDWDTFDCYWPCFEIYNQALCSIMHLPSGKPADMCSVG